MGTKKKYVKEIFSGATDENSMEHDEFVGEDLEVIEVAEAGDDIAVQVLSWTLFRNTRQPFFKLNIFRSIDSL